MKALFIGLIFMLLMTILLSCLQETKIVEKKVIKEIYRPMDVKVIKAQYDLQAKRFSKNLKEKLNAKSPFPIFFHEQTMRGLYAFQMHHLSYEFRQIRLYRKF